MRSVRWRELTKTFRFRLAIMHVLLVSVALAITFVIALLLARGTIVRLAKVEMEVSLRSARIAYQGGKLEEDTAQLPEDLMERVGKQFPRMHIGMVEREAQPGGTLYEIIASTGEEWLEILADPNGDIWVADRKPIQEVFAAMEESMRSGGSPGIVLYLCAPDGLLLAGSPSGHDLVRAHQLMDRLDGTSVVRTGDDLYGGLILYDGNRLYAVKDMEEMEQVTLWAFEFLAVLLVFFIPLSGWIGFVISRKSMAGVRRVTDAAHRVEAGNFKERVAGASEGAEIEELVSAFNTMVSRIDVLMRELRDVTANIAHDLKTPITRIRGLLESMKWEEISAQEREQIVASTLEECDRIMPLMDSILELSRAEAGMLVLERESFDLAAEVRKAHDMFSAVADDCGITFICTVPDIPVHMLGDCGRMQRVIANLVDNALKFTPKGGEVVMHLETNANQAVLTIRDNGPGIPRNELENVFKRFYRLDPSRGTSGHGMGLSLVRAFVNAFGGSVSIESDTGLGCAITVVLPVSSDKGDSRI